jgi:Ser/Thr protein kinase RdoA (MazF antagonist)
VKPWEQLTERGRLGRLRTVAIAALSEYDVEVRRMSLIGGFVNALFRVDTPDGPLALRIDLMQEHSDADAELELEWLEALSGHVNVGVPIRTIQGALYTHVRADGVPGARRCVLFSWVPGSPLADRITPRRFEECGSLSAELHVHGERHHPRRRPMVWDRVHYFPEDVDPVVYHLPDNADVFPEGGLEVVERAIAIVQPRLAAVTDRQIVHGDLHIWNVHARRNEVWALDFEDIMWGSRGQDIAISLYYIQDRPDCAELTAAFRRGYERVAPWPTDDAELAIFMAARRLMFVNYVFNIDAPDRREFVAMSVKKLETILRSLA